MIIIQHIYNTENKITSENQSELSFCKTLENNIHTDYKGGGKSVRAECRL